MFTTYFPISLSGVVMPDNNDINDVTEVKSEKKFKYHGTVHMVAFWFCWSIIGYFFIVFTSNKTSFLEIFYLVSSILAVMAINNRKYGVNHTIRFYKDHIVVPKILNIWLWNEEIIEYSEINEINVVDYGEPLNKNFCEIELKTDLFSYPIFGKKLSKKDFKEIYEILRDKTKLRLRDLPQFNSESVDKPKQISWQGHLALIALIVSGWTIIGISLSSPYSNLVSGSSIFLISFFYPGSQRVIIFFKLETLYK